MSEPMKEILWAVYTNTDLTEGRGRQYVSHFCRLQATAIRLAKKGYVQGSDCPVKPVEVLNFDGKRVLPADLLMIWEPSKNDEAKEEQLRFREEARAKAKAAGLSDEDIAILEAPRHDQ